MGIGLGMDAGFDEWVAIVVLRHVCVAMLAQKFAESGYCAAAIALSG
ncbi:hypothetical protein [Burkholderia sp. IMCC1007]|nr:hypothetical protein [Burkholderia sp. IMCC1007]